MNENYYICELDAEEIQDILNGKTIIFTAEEDGFEIRVKKDSK